MIIVRSSPCRRTGAHHLTVHPAVGIVRQRIFCSHEPAIHRRFSRVHPDFGSGPLDRPAGRCCAVRTEWRVYDRLSSIACGSSVASSLGLGQWRRGGVSRERHSMVPMMTRMGRPGEIGSFATSCAWRCVSSTLPESLNSRGTLRCGGNPQDCRRESFTAPLRSP